MCVAYNRENQLIYTGGHDGSLIAWNFETGYIKYYLHELDAGCTTKTGNYILESKSVDCVRFPLTLITSILDLDYVRTQADCFSIC
jgi:hypothetical protein